MASLGWSVTDEATKEYTTLREWDRIVVTARGLAEGGDDVESLASRGEAIGGDWEKELVQAWRVAGSCPGTVGEFGYFTYRDVWRDEQVEYKDHGHCGKVSFSVGEIPKFAVQTKVAAKGVISHKPVQAQKRPLSNPVQMSLPKKPVQTQPKKKEFEVVITQVASIDGGGRVGSSPVKTMGMGVVGGRDNEIDVDSERHSIATLRMAAIPQPNPQRPRGRNRPPPQPPTYTEPTVLCPVSAQTGCGLSFSRTDTAAISSHLSTVHALDQATLQASLESARYEKITCPACAYTDTTTTPIATLAAHLRSSHKYTLSAAGSTAEKPWKALGRLKK